MKRLYILYIFVILILLLVGNVEAYHTTNKYGRYDDQNPKRHKDIIIINNNINIRNSVVIFDGTSRSYYRKYYYRDYTYDRYDSYRYYDRRYRDYRYDGYRYRRYIRTYPRYVYTGRDSSYIY